MRHVRAGAVWREGAVARAAPAGRGRPGESDLRHVDHGHRVRLLARDEEETGVRREAHPARIPRHGDLLDDRVGRRVDQVDVDTATDTVVKEIAVTTVSVAVSIRWTSSEVSLE